MGVAEVSSGLKDSRKVEVVREWKREVSVRILTCWTSDTLQQLFLQQVEARSVGRDRRRDAERVYKESKLEG